MKTKTQSKTAAIREALKKHGSPSEVSAVLKKRGLQVSPQYVSTIKANDKRRAASGISKRGPGRPPGSGKSKSANANGTLKPDFQAATELLTIAMELVLRCGSAGQARQLVDAADKLIGKVG